MNPSDKVTVKQRGQLVLIGLNRPSQIGMRATLEAAHIAVNDSAHAAAYARLEAGYVALFGSEDFLEGRKAEAENRPPIFHGR